ncbi:MAG: O-acetyl-ADP-ribose deacetylase [Planctomycetota bacterium]
MSPFQRINCALGDITREAVDAIVNAANEQLRGGGGVDGAIHRAAGPGLLDECRSRYPDGCPTGEARITAGYRLPAKHVIHTVGPVYGDGHSGEADALSSCYRSSVALAVAHDCTSLAFPAISCGVYGYPAADAAEVALTALGQALEAHPSIVDVRLVLFGDELLDIFSRALTQRRP